MIVLVDLRIFEKRRTFEALPVKQLILIMFLEGVVFSLQENHIDRRGYFARQQRQYVVVVNIKRDFLIYGCQFLKGGGVLWYLSTVSGRNGT